MAFQLLKYTKYINAVMEGRRKRGRPKFRWKDSVSNDMREKGLREQDVQDRGRWRRLTNTATKIEMGKVEDKEEDINAVVILT